MTSANLRRAFAACRTLLAASAGRHLGVPPPRVDRGRGILYGGPDLVCCLGEFFADSGAVHVPGTRVARLDLSGAITLVDLRGTAALGVGTTQAIGGISQRRTTQAWARALTVSASAVGA